MAKKDIIDLFFDAGIDVQPAGNQYKALCPFHDERTPSLMIYPDTQSWYCFGCGAGGDVIEFVKRIKGISYMAAVKDLGLEEDHFSLNQLRSKLQAEPSSEILAHLNSWYLLGNKLLHSKKLSISQESKLLDQYYVTGDITSLANLVQKLSTYPTPEKNFQIPPLS